jgi:signal transduction histidine kinase
VELDTPEDMMIDCDPLKLRQALNNLIENAIKYSYDKGHVAVRVRKIGQEAHISIEDKGVGMDQEHLSHIFERFYRVDKARARGTGGTGLGLYIVRRIALLHGGRVEVYSKKAPIAFYAEPFATRERQ